MWQTMIVICFNRFSTICNDSVLLDSLCLVTASEYLREGKLPGTSWRIRFRFLFMVNYVEEHTTIKWKEDAAIESGRALWFVVDRLRVINACVHASKRDTSYKVQVLFTFTELLHCFTTFVMTTYMNWRKHIVFILSTFY